VCLVNALEQEKARGKGGRISLMPAADRLGHPFDELGYLPFSHVGGALLIHLPSKLYEHASVMIATSRALAEWSSVFGDATLMPYRLTHHCHIDNLGEPRTKSAACSSSNPLKIGPREYPSQWLPTEIFMP
jgi:hypothetical protein